MQAIKEFPGYPDDQDFDYNDRWYAERQHMAILQETEEVAKDCDEGLDWVKPNDDTDDEGWDG